MQLDINSKMIKRANYTLRTVSARYRYVTLYSISFTVSLGCARLQLNTVAQVCFYLDLGKFNIVLLILMLRLFWL